MTAKRDKPPQRKKSSEVRPAEPKRKAKPRASKATPAEASSEPAEAKEVSLPAKARAAKKAPPRRAAPPRSSTKAVKRAARVAPPSEVQLELDITDTDVVSEDVPELGLGSRVVPPNVVFTDPPEPVASPSPPLSGDVAAQIRALEARLDGLMRSVLAAPQGGASPQPTPSASPGAGEASESVAPPAPAINTSAYFERQWGRLGMRNRAEEVDDFGLDPEYERKTRRLFEFLYKRYFRVATEGITNVPDEGRCIVVANHSGTLPLDGMMLRTALRLEHPRARELRWLAEDFLFYLPFAGVFMNRVGAVRACPENAERLLSKEAVVTVFPEGIHGIKKLFRERYQLQRFGRGGYIRLALRMRAPIIPCAIVGAEETNPLLYRIESMAELFGVPYIPVTPTFPLLGPLGLVPAPTRWRIKFGEPIQVGSYGPEAADDQLLVSRLSDRVRSAIQGLLDSGLRERRSIWFG